MKIDKLYFGITLLDPSTKKLHKHNLFASSRVQRSIAIWAQMDKKERKRFDGVHFCFGDTQGRCEYECIICPWPYKGDSIEEEGEKYDTFTMYVEPNAEYLMSLVNQISASEGKRWLRDNK